MTLPRKPGSGVTTRDFGDVDVLAIASGLRERLAWQRRQIELPPGKYEVILPPAATSELMTYLYWSASARDAAEGRSVFSKPDGGTRVNERLTPMPVSLYSDPGYPGLECAPFVVARTLGRDLSVFDNGLPFGRTEWVSQGVLSALRSSRYSAARAGLSVSPPVGNLIMTGGVGATASLESMIASTSRGLLLTCLWYVRIVDKKSLLLTGITRDGVYLIENGEIVGAVNNFRFNESPAGLLPHLLEAGVTQPTLAREWGLYFSRTAMPPLRVEAFNMSSASPAS